MIDNFDQIANEVLQFDNQNEFYFIQIIRRAKDNNEIGSSNQYIKSYSVYSVKDFLDKKVRIIDLCNKLNARAYIHPSPRNDRDIALMMLEELASVVRTRQYSNARNLYATMCGRYMPPRGKKLWIIDHDAESFIEIDTVIRWLSFLRPEGDKVRHLIPTKNGTHIITTPFDIQAWTQMYLDNQILQIDVHKNNPTVLYCP